VRGVEKRESIKSKREREREIENVKTNLKLIFIIGHLAESSWPSLFGRR
jgi:hypothetical protein